MINKAINEKRKILSFKGIFINNLSIDMKLFERFVDSIFFEIISSSKISIVRLQNRDKQIIGRYYKNVFFIQHLKY